MIQKQKKEKTTTKNNKQLFPVLNQSISIYFKGIPTKKPHTQHGFKLIIAQLNFRGRNSAFPKKKTGLTRPYSPLKI